MKKDIKIWLNNNYLEEERKTLTDLYLNEKGLEGGLSLKWEDFPKLERVWHPNQLRILTNFDLNIATLLKRKITEGVFLEVESNVEVLKYTLIDEVMGELYPEDIREKITKLDLTQKGLRGSLDLRGFGNLEELTINMDCPWGRKYTNSNHITGFNFDGLDKLTKLILTNNPAEWEVGRLDGLTSLEKLVIKGEPNYPAQWTNTLKDLENLEHLTELDISYNPHIKLGLESLKNLEKLECRGTIYEKPLKTFSKDINAWKVIVHPEVISEDNGKIIQKINECLNESHGYLKFLNEKGYTDRDLENKIKLLETKSREMIISVA